MPRKQQDPHENRCCECLLEINGSSNKCDRRSERQAWSPPLASPDTPSHHSTLSYTPCLASPRLAQPAIHSPGRPMRSEAESDWLRARRWRCVA
ncbi:hypothetical protein E2C01_008030 [Portunus trituberculatus]|uniref:Uncharacterized protein n=1 Tax=Portunus trituberculatus TaxID=210409 RepID=A0A5B7D1P7_PORTR|nr:hypothetical protein [Portunus trituberculatus]